MGTSSAFRRVGQIIRKYVSEQKGISNLIITPAIWTAVSLSVSGLIYGGADISRYFSQAAPTAIPTPFREDRVGILVARFENDPNGEYSLRVRNALERQFPVAADGSTAVEVDFYPKPLTMPVQGRLSENLERARNEGREWLNAQNAELLIWGRAVPSEKELELRILARQSAEGGGLSKPELYPIRIPSEFSDQLGAALAGLVAGAGFNAWSQRGEFLTPERKKSLVAWLARLKTLRDELPASLDEKNRSQIHAKITTAYAQIGAALIADGNSGIAMEVLNEIIPEGEAGNKGVVFSYDPLLFAEIIADVVSRFLIEAGHIGKLEVSTLLEQVDGISNGFKAAHEHSEIEDDVYAYLRGLMCMLAGNLRAYQGEKDAAVRSFTEGREKFRTLLDAPSQSQDQLSRARVQSYLGNVELGLAQLGIPDTDKMLAAAIGNFGQALQSVNANEAPREIVRIKYLLATAYHLRWGLNFDVNSLVNAITSLVDIANILGNNQRGNEAAGVTLQAARLLGTHAFVANGVDSARKSLEIIDAVSSVWQNGNAAAAYLVHLRASAEYARCAAHVAAAYRMEAKGTSDDANAAMTGEVKQGIRNCETALDLFEQQGNAFSWIDAKLLISDANRIQGERTGDTQVMAKALATAEEAARRNEGLNDASLTAQAIQTKAAILRVLGLAEKQPARLKEALDLNRKTWDSLPEGAPAVQRYLAEFQLGRSLTALAMFENTAGENLKEGIRLLSDVRTRFSNAGAVLLAQDAAKALEKAEQHLARSSVN